MVTPNPAKEIDEILTTLCKEINNIDLQQVAPPMISQFFTIHRELAYAKLEKVLEGKQESEKDELILEFIRKTDLEMLPEFKKKIRSQYILKIMSKDYNMPEQVSTVDAKKYELNAELLKLGEHVADWSIELELLTDLFSSLELYGIINLDNKSEGYLKAFKKEFRPKHVNDLRTSADFLLRNGARYLLKQVSRLMLVKGINTTQVTAPLVMRIISEVVATRVIPWATLFQLVSVPWLLGSFGLYFGLSKIAAYLTKDELREKINNCDESMVVYKLFLAERRAKVIEYLQEYYGTKTEERTKEEIRKDIEREVAMLIDESQVEELILLEKLTEKNEKDMTDGKWQMYEGDEDFTIIAETKYKEEEIDGFTIVDKS